MTHILLVDDDDLFRKAVRLMLEKMGAGVVEARNGLEAVQLCRQKQPDLVLMDLIMPEQEGLQTIRELRHAYPQLKIIAMSGGGRLNNQDYLKIAKMLGADRVLEKPFAYADLVATVTELSSPAEGPAKTEKN